jgi:hypothetical protein
MAAPKVYPKTCQKCSGYFRGNKLQRLCDACRVAADRDCDPARQTGRICMDCNVSFQGHRLTKRCVPCQAEYARTYNLRRKKLEYEARKALRAADRSRPKIPPACMRCHYCKETDAYPSGMVCLAEAFMRCQPWNLGAKPLKEREQ